MQKFTTFEIEIEKPIEQLQHNLKITDSRLILGALYDNELIGIVTFVRDSNLKTTHKGSVYAMYVSPKYRGRGIGNALMSELINLANKCDGLEQVYLTVISNNNAAKRLYKNVGFVIYGTERNALKTGDQYWDEDLMVLRLN
jgi:ribosomal protein S18 acetylase RimI-like enzyme